MEGGAGQAWTTTEKAAAADAATRVLDQEDPSPQTIYRVTAKPGAPVMIMVPLRYADGKVSARQVWPLGQARSLVFGFWSLPAD
jgi:hypothetical protein